ncbi:MAG: hypothetical protein SchgKO_23490 [Schleiferiaceae bacterium]
MKITLIPALVLTATLWSCSSSKPSVPKTSSMVATTQLKEPVEGVCDMEHVYHLMPFFGEDQVEAVPNLTEEQLQEKLNAEVSFLKDHPGHEDKGMIFILVNCKGEMVQVKMDNETQSPELDAQIVAVFEQLTDWKAGTLGGKSVDTSLLFSFTIEDGKITL